MLKLTQEEFKKKYGDTALQDFSQPKPTGGVADFAKGAAKGAADTAITTSRFLQGAGQKVLDVFGADTSKTGFESMKGDQAKQIDEQLAPKNDAEKAGKTTETIAEFLLPFAKTKTVETAVAKTLEKTKGAIGAVKEAGSKLATDVPDAADKVAKAVLGEADTQLVKSGQNPMVELFKTGKKRVSDVVSNVEKGIDSFVKDSKKSLQAVKDSIPEVDIGVQKVAEKVNEGIMNSIQHSADYKGLKQGFETVDDIINSGILKPEESQRLEKVVEFIGKWKDTSARGTLNLKEALSNFYATGENYTGSNAVVRSIQRNLVDLVGETAPEIKTALKTASKNIDKTEEFVQHLFGKDAATGESKILTLARNLADKAKNGYKVDLIKELEKVSGMKITEDLQGIYDYLQSSKLKAPGLQKPIETVKYVVKKAIEKGVKLK